MNRGFVLIVALLLLLFTSSAVVTHSIVQERSMKQLVLQKRLDEINQLEAIVIKRIKEEYYQYEEEDFTMELFDCQVRVHYDEMKAEIMVTGKYEFQSCLLYNDQYATVQDYYYVK